MSLLDTQFPPESPYYRVGVFNDGMFGSEDDLDTYQNREAEINWLSSQAAHTPYGGETNYDQSTDGFDYTDGNFVCQEMFRTHVTYLNDEWPEETIDGWRRTAYEGPDPVYAGLSTYAYFENHMGYRYVLRSFDVVDGALRFTVENVGAGNMLKEKTAVLVLTDDRGSVLELPTGIDVRTWTSRTLATESVPCPAGPGTYRVYLQIRDGNGNNVRLANDNPFDEYGNLLGVIQVPER